MKNFFEYRENINKIDSEIVNLLAKRFDLANKILEIKHLSNLPLEDDLREKAILDRLYAEHPEISSKLLESIFSLIFKFNKRINHEKFANTLCDNLKNRPLIIAGPCTIENENHILMEAKALSELGIKFMRSGAYKPRTSPHTFQGLGDYGIEVARKAADQFNLFIVAEVLEINQLERNYDKIDVVQIGSKNMFSYGFLKQIGQLTKNTQKPIILKRGFNSTLNEFIYASEYIRNEGNDNIILCLRGIRTYEQIDSKFRNTPDLASILELRSMTNLPIIFDPSHATGNSKYVPEIAKAALSLNVDGIMFESHFNPDKAFVDGHQSITHEVLKKFINELI